MAISRYRQYSALELRYGIKNKDMSVRGFFRGLRRIECRLRRNAIGECSIENYKGLSDDQVRVLLDTVIGKFVNKELMRKELYYNGDPRGNSLKLAFYRSGVPHTEGIERDWGGEDGILAPDDMI